MKNLAEKEQAMYSCRHLLPEPGNEAVLECLKTINQLRGKIKVLKDSANEITRWDWSHLLVDHPDSEVLIKDVQQLDAILKKI